MKHLHALPSKLNQVSTYSTDISSFGNGLPQGIEPLRCNISKICIHVLINCVLHTNVHNVRKAVNVALFGIKNELAFLQ